jgi:hypothetical protein
MATGAPSASDRSSEAACPTLDLQAKGLFGRGVEPSLVFGSRNKRWLDFARHDSMDISENTSSGIRIAIPESVHPYALDGAASVPLRAQATRSGDPG